MTLQTQVAPPARPGQPTFVFEGARTGPAAIYEGFRAQQRELTDQLDDIESTRDDISSNLMQLPAGSPQREVLESRLTEINKRISVVDGMLASNSASLAQAAAVPGAVVEAPRIVRQGPPEEVIITGLVFTAIVLLPLSIAMARRIWKRSASAVTTFPRELADRLSGMEHALEATSIEVERIGEGQRFLTRLFTEGEGARALPGASDVAGGTRLPGRKQGTSERLP